MQLNNINNERTGAKRRYQRIFGTVHAYAALTGPTVKVNAQTLAHSTRNGGPEAYAMG